MKKLIALVAVVAALSVTGYFGYQHHVRTEYVESLVPHLKNASIRVTNSSDLDTKSSQVTFKEMFARLDGDIEEIEKRLIEIQSASSPKNEAIYAPAVAYLRAAQEYSRALYGKHRKSLASSNALDRFKDAAEDMVSASYYGHDAAKRRVDRAGEEAKKAIKESALSQESVVQTANGLKAARDNAAKIYPEHALVSKELLDEVIATNTPKTEDKAQEKSPGH